MSQDLQCIANPSSWVMATKAHYSIFFCVSERFHDKTNKKIKARLSIMLQKNKHKNKQINHKTGC